ncbi:LytR/AlgR family response regulator transcription factor [Pontibacter sp. MBLB2868]|uniref:LytR/AlgR family response regulator transcription factor n=1 Tax=Pontibacter sp. MBLB2868 TaxID=3451555 RepID=UPI003F754FF4
MIKCFVVDDEAHAIEVLQRYIEKTPGLVLIGTAENPLLALDDITGGKLIPEIVFVDIDMPQLSGVELAELISKYTRVVFTTAYANYALQAFEKNAVDYLLKPITYERFLKSVNKIRESIHAKACMPAQQRDLSYIFIKSETKGKMIKVNLEEVIYIEALQNYIKIHVGKSTHVTYLTMKEIEEHLPRCSFARVHKSFIVSLDKVKAVEGNQLVLLDDTVVTIGISYRESVMQNIHARLVKSKRLP